ncbi:MAG: TIGR03435 family protein [Bryobacteraceae bacterium]
MKLWVLAALLASPVFSQAAFDVVSIKPNPNCDAFAPSRGMSGQGQLALECADLRDLILAAYGIYANGAVNAADFRMQVVGGPRWMDEEHFEILARTAANPSTAELLGPMLRSLLEERFHLKVHRETKEGRIYKLTVDRDGPKLQPSSDQGCLAALPNCTSVSVSQDGKVDLRGATMGDLSARLGMSLDREVTDATGLTGRYDLTLQVDPRDLNPRFVAGRDASPAGDVGWFVHLFRNSRTRAKDRKRTRASPHDRRRSDRTSLRKIASYPSC